MKNLVMRFLQRYAYAVITATLAAAVLLNVFCGQPVRKQGEPFVILRPTALSTMMVTLPARGPLPAVLADLSAQTHVPFRIDLKQFASEEVDVNNEVYLDWYERPTIPVQLHQALQMVRMRFGDEVTFDIESDRVFCSIRGGMKAHRVEVRYFVGDLVNQMQVVGRFGRGLGRESTSGWSIQEAIEYTGRISNAYAELETRSDEETQEVVVTGTPAQHEMIRELLAALRRR